MTQDQITSMVERCIQGAGLATKKILSFEEAVQFTGLSKSYLYKLTSQQRIPQYRPSGKLLYFERDELERWLMQNRVSTTDEIERKAQSYCMKGGRR